MRINDCVWEKRNLNCTTVEVILKKGEDIKFDDINYLKSNYEYIVVKVPVNQPATNILLSKENFVFLETQYRLSKKIKSFNEEDPLIDLLKSDLQLRFVNKPMDFEQLLSNIDVQMFSTDRICIDPLFGPEIGTNRYKSWMIDEFLSNSSKFIIARKCNEDIGFCMLKENDNNIEGLLGGIFYKFQEQGLGLLTPSFPFLAQKLFNKEYKNVVTSISSNNIPVVQLYNYLNFKIINTTYVFIKHIKKI